MVKNKHLKYEIALITECLIDITAVVWRPLSEADQTRKKRLRHVRIIISLLFWTLCFIPVAFMVFVKLDFFGTECGFVLPQRLLTSYLTLESKQAAHSRLFGFPLAPHFKCRINKYTSV